MVVYKISFALYVFAPNCFELKLLIFLFKLQLNFIKNETHTHLFLDIILFFLIVYISTVPIHLFLYLFMILGKKINNVFFCSFIGRTIEYPTPMV